MSIAEAIKEAVHAAEFPDHRLRLPELIEYRIAAAKRRAEAFCDAPQAVLGITLVPLCPRTFSALVACGNRFLCGGAPDLGDVIDYLWLHAPNWTGCWVDGWAAKKRRHVSPLMVQIRQPWRRILGLKPKSEHIAAALALAITDIRALVDEAFADTTAQTGRPGAPIATLEAHFIHLCAAEYGWKPERTRATPLKQLFQLNRCMRQGRGEEIEDNGEQRIHAQHLAKLNAPALAKRNGGAS